MRVLPPSRSPGGSSTARSQGSGSAASPAASPEAYPLSGATDLLGRMPVRLRAEDGDLVAYGFENQRIAIPAADIGAVYVHRGWGKQWGRSGPALAVIGQQGQLLLRAPGRWSTTMPTAGTSPRSRIFSGMAGGLDEVCASLRLNRPQYLTLREVRQKRRSLRRAPGYHKVRIRSRGYVFTRLALVLLGFILGGLGIALGVLLASLIPAGAGDVRVLIGILLCVAALWGALWLCGFVLRTLNWLALSLNVRTLAPPDRFFGTAFRGRNRKAQTWLTLLMILAIPMLVAWGPIIGLISLAHGFSDQALVGQLRQGGISVPGFVIDVPTYSTDDNGDTVVTDHATLLFGTRDGAVVKTPDPAIAGWTWPMDPDQQVTIVYNRSDPDTAAVAGQISGSPWHGAPTGNVIAGAVLTIALVPLTWATVRRVRKARRASREGFFEGIG